MTVSSTQANLDGVIDIFSQVPHLAEQLIFDHQADDFGRCSAGCRAGGDMSLVLRHPCTIFSCATTALLRYYRREGGTVPPGLQLASLSEV